MNYTSEITQKTHTGDNNFFISLISTNDTISGIQSEKESHLFSAPTSIPTTQEIKPTEIYTKEPIEDIPIKKILSESLEFINDILETEDVIERENITSLFKDNLESLWNLGKEIDKNFADVIVLLQVAVINSQYENYTLQQYQAIKQVLEKIKKIYISSDESSECTKLLVDNDIDLSTPIRNWEKYSIEIKEIK